MSIHDKKPDDFYSWSQEERKKWWAPRNAAHRANLKAKAKTTGERKQQEQQKHQQQKAKQAKKEKEKKKAAEAEEVAQPPPGAPTGPRVQSRPHQQVYPAPQPPMGAPTGPRIQSRPHQQGYPARHQQVGRFSEWHQLAHTPYHPSNPIATVASAYDPLPPRQNPLDPLRPHPTAALSPAVPSATSPVVTAGAPSPAAPTQVGGKSKVQKSKPTRKEKRKAAKKNSEGLEKALERARLDERKKVEEEMKKQQEERIRTAEETSMATDRQFNQLYEQNERNMRLGLVNSLYDNTMAAWENSLHSIRNDHAAAVAVGDSARAGLLTRALARAAEFRAQAVRMVAEARRDLASPEGAETRERRFSEELTRALLLATVAISDLTAAPAAPAAPALPHMDAFGHMVNSSGQLVDAIGDLVDGDFYLIDTVSGHRRLDFQGRPIQGRRSYSGPSFSPRH